MEDLICLLATVRTLNRVTHSTTLNQLRTEKQMRGISETFFSLFMFSLLKTHVTSLWPFLKSFKTIADKQKFDN